MSSLLAWLLDSGTALVIWMQQASPALDLPVHVVTFLGSEAFFLVVIPFLYWTLDRKVGGRLAPLFLLSVYVNAGAKHWAGQPRPFLYDASVMQLTHALEEGFPSGHTQQTVVLWGFLALTFRRRWLWLLAAVLMVLVPLSRLYLGVHFPHDLLGGYVLGFGLLWLYVWLEPAAAELVRHWPLWRQLAATLLLGVGLTLLVRTSYAVVGPAVLTGVWVGQALERRWVGFETEGSWRQRLLRFLMGIVLVAAVYGGLSAVQAELSGALMLVRWVKYALVGMTVTLAAPWAFVRLGLAARDQRNHTANARGSLTLQS
jgi:glycerophosphoryl diester phosphodiesterase